MVNCKLVLEACSTGVQYVAQMNSEWHWCVRMAARGLGGAINVVSTLTVVWPCCDDVRGGKAQTIDDLEQCAQAGLGSSNIQRSYFGHT